MRKHHNSFRRNLGFSLVELMVAVAIIGILAGIAIPAYREYLIKANRTAAKQYLMAVTNKQEQYLLDKREYASTLGTLGLTAPSELSGKYSCALQNVTASPPAYEALCTAEGSQSGDGDLKIDQAGTKTGKW